MPAGSSQSSDSMALHYSLAQASIRARLFGKSMTPWRVGRFHIIDKLGEGGMGVVYAAYDEHLDRKVALKFLRSQTQFTDERAHGRMLREAQAMARLSHPNVVQVYDVGTHGGEVFLAMEFVRGTTLDTWLDAKRRRAQDIVDVFLQAGRALAAAHAAGLVHRDFKPGNVLVRADGHAVVSDFGSARGIELPPAGDDAAVDDPTFSASSSAGLTERLTLTGAILGTPAYMSPEQHRGKLAGPQSDQFSYCVAMFEALCGELPFSGRNRAELYASICTDRIEFVSVKGLAARVLPVLRRGLSSDPEQRFSDMNALLAALTRASGRMRRLVAGTLGGVALASAAVVWAAYPQEQASPCTAQVAAIDTVWNLASQRAIAQRFLEVDPQAHVDAEGVSRAVNVYAERWRSASNRACTETHDLGLYSAGILDQRAACLQRRRSELGALLDVFVDADAATVKTARVAVSQLRRPSVCDDVAALSRGITPSDPQLAAGLVAVRGIIAKAEASMLAGRAAQSLEQAQDALVAARAIGYEPLVAEALTAVGWAQYMDGEQKAAEDSLYEAIDLAEANRDDETSAEAWNRLLMAMRAQATPANAENTIGIYRRTQSAIKRLQGDNTDRMAEALSSMAYIYKMLSRLVDATQLSERALKIRQAADDPEPRQIMRSQSLLADIYSESGRWRESLALYDQARQSAASVYGPRHTRFADLLVNAALAQVDGGSFDTAASGLAQALDIYERPGNRIEDDIGWVHAARSYLAYGQHQAATAKAQAEAARAIYDEVLEPQDPRRSDPIKQAARAAYALGNADVTLALAREALAIQDPNYESRTNKRGQATREVATLLLWVGRALTALGEYREAAAYLDDAVESFDALFPEAKTHHRFVHARLSRGANRLMLGELAEAKLDFEHAAEGAPATPPHFKLEARARAGLDAVSTQSGPQPEGRARLWRGISDRVIGAFPE